MTLKTPLNENHRKLNAKMIEFGGWDMPVDYGSLLEEHEWVRTRCGLFDVSHMGEFLVSGDEALDLLQSVTCNDVSKLELNQVQYNALIHPTGGVVDDVTIYRLADTRYMVCVNASNIGKDWNFISTYRENFTQVNLQDRSTAYALIAIQGPQAEDAFAQCFPEHESIIRSLNYYRLHQLPDSILSRTGYTGEDGFEWFIPAESVVAIWEKLLACDLIKPIGLGARDTLRLEAKYPLYGHELNDQNTIIEGGQGWIVKDKQPAPACQAKLLEQKKSGPEVKVTAFILLDPGIARQDYSVVDENGQKIGVVTSGSFSPSLKKAIGLARIKTGFIQEGGTIGIEVRGQIKKAQIKTKAFLELGAGKKGKTN